MIEQKDASKSDERQVKNTSNPLTQKLKGEKQTMGNRGMNNWKLGAFFVIGLMLIAAVFSNTVMAATGDGEGTVTVGWGVRTSGTIDTTGVLNAIDLATAPSTESRVADTTVDPVVTENDGTLPLSAGSLGNILIFTYTAFKDVPDPDTQVPPVDQDVANVADANDMPINMAGGEVRIDLSGWTVSNKFVTIMDRPQDDSNPVTLLYQTNGKGEQQLKSEEQKKRLARVTFEASDYVLVKLDTAWGGGSSRDIGRRIVIVCGDVTAAIPRDLPSIDGRADGSADATTQANDIPYAGDEFLSSSKSKNGTHLLLSAHPSVRVGNILGTRTEANKKTSRDNATRTVTIKPDRVFMDEKMKYPVKITFVAPGPMHGGNLEVTIPNGLLPAPFSGPFDDADLPDVLPDSLTDLVTDLRTNRMMRHALASQLVKARGGAGLDLYRAADSDNPMTDDSNDETYFDFELVNGDDVKLTIPFGKVNVGQEVIIEYNLAEIGMAGVSDPDDPGSKKSAFTVTTTVTPGSTATNVTAASTDQSVDVTGGAVSGTVGSGRMQISPVSLEAGAPQRTFTLTYTAYTKLTDVNIRITADGIITVDPNENDDIDIELQTDTASDYGHVSGSVSSSASTAPDAPTVSGDFITWEGVTLVKDDKLTTTISRVDVTETPDNYEWEVVVDGNLLVDDKNTKDIDDRAILSVVDTSAESVKFEVDGDDSFPAASSQKIVFKFTAVDTPIRDGSVWFRIPSTLGSAPVQPKNPEPNAKTVLGIVSASGGTLEKDQPTVSGSTVTVAIKTLDVGDVVTITYGTGDKEALLHNVAGEVKLIGNFKTSSGSRSAGTATVTLTNVADGDAQEVKISPREVEAGSSHHTISITFKALGTMDDGRVSLELPTTGRWGTMQVDPAEKNYVRISGNSNVVLEEPAVDAPSNKAVAKITKLAAGQTFTFEYGGGSAGSNNGAQVQDNIGTATFMIRSDGDGDGVFAAVTTEVEQNARAKVVNPKKLGQVFKDAAGQLKIQVDAAADGTGSVVVLPIETRAGNLEKLTFTYTSTQTIQGGELRFTVPSKWSPPQVSSAGEEGYTIVGGLGLGTAEVPEGKRYVIVPISSIAKDDDITITYGASDEGKAKAPAVVGSSVFTFAVRGTADGRLRSLSSGPAEVTIKRQAGGKAKSAIATISDPQGAPLYAGQDNREITVTYTTAAEMVNAKVRLTIPAKATDTDVEEPGWSAPTADNVTVTASSSGSIGEITYGGSQATPNQMVIVEDVNLMAEGTVTFVYTGKVQPTAGSATFAVATDGGLEGDVFTGVSGPTPESVMLTLDVNEAKKGSGEAEIADSDKVVEPGATVTLTFTYTAVGEISYPREFRVRVPRGEWSPPTDETTSPDNMGTYSVEHISNGSPAGNRIVEKINPVGRDMVARVRSGILHVVAGDQIVFTYENATAPAEDEVSTFKVLFGGQTNDAVVGDIEVAVQSTSPTQLALSGEGTVSAGEPLAITVELQDAAGLARRMVDDVEVTFTSSSEGTFSETADGVGTVSTTVDIGAGETSAMVYYSDSTAGTATITAIASGLTMKTQDVMVEAAPTAPVDPPVDPDVEPVVAITEGSIMVSPALAMGTIAGTAVTVSAMGTAGQMATFSIGSIVTDGSMTEDEAGSYSGSFSVVVDQHADGMYGVSVTLNADATTTMTVADALTIDSTDPTVTVTAPESAMNGDEVMISAMVTDAGMISSVTADVSMLDSTQTDPVALPMGEDGAYSASVTISDENSHANGSKTITVTAMDAAGNSGEGEATVMLANTLSYTSMIPAGISLFHVPLDVDGLDTVGDLKGRIGNGSNLAIVYDHATGSWNSRSDDVAITADLGIVLSMGSAATYTFEGEAWDGGASMISLSAGTNLIGLPVNDPRVTNVSDIAGLFAEGVVSSIIISTDDGFELVSDTTDAAVMGDAAYLVTASAAGTATLLGDGWTYSDMAGAAPIALAGFSVEGQTPVLDVNGSIVDEITGLAREGFRVKVKNLSTKASLNRVTSLEVEAGGYNMTFVDLKSGNAARIGDVLEISADSPSPLIGVQPVRHIVTADDVKSGILELEDLIAYEIPAETELLRNYPNPFNPETWIPYRLAEDADVSLTIYDVNGELVRSIDVGHQSAAVYESRAKAIYWDGRNRFGEQVASGIYFYSLSTGDFSATRKMVILK